MTLNVMRICAGYVEGVAVVSNMCDNMGHVSPSKGIRNNLA